MAVDLSYLSTDADDRMAGAGEVSFLSTSGLTGAPSGLNNTSLLTETAGLTHKESRRLLQQVKHLNHVIEGLKQENETLKSTERLHSITVRQTKDAARRVFLANEQAEKMKSELEKEKAKNVESVKNLTMVRSEVGALHENRQLRDMAERGKHELANIYQQLQETENKRRKERKINQFVMKHVPGAAIGDNKQQGTRTEQGGTGTRKGKIY